jgi:hypothetical protein
VRWILAVSAIVVVAAIALPAFTQTVATALSAIATLALAALTYSYVRATLQLVRSSNRTLTEMQETRRATTRPYVFVYFTVFNRAIYLNVRNAGQTAAADVRLDLPESFDGLKRERWRQAAFIARGVPFLPPSQKLRTVLNLLPEYQPVAEAEGLPMDWDCTVTYRDHQTGEVYRERMLLDLHQFTDRVSMGPSFDTETSSETRDLVKEIHQITEALRDLGS